MNRFYLEKAEGVKYIVPFRNALRVARTKTHPDKEGGDAEAFKRVEEAAELLAKHHGVIG